MDEELRAWTFEEEPSDEKTKTCGWLSPSGEFFICDDYQHENFAEENFSKTDTELLESGWVRCSGVARRGRGGFSCKRLTEWQRIKLRSLGYRVIEGNL